MNFLLRQSRGQANKKTGNGRQGDRISHDVVVAPSACRLFFIETFPNPRFPARIKGFKRFTGGVHV